MTDGKTAMAGGTVDILKASDFAMVAGDSVKVLLGLPAGSVNCVVTSPPYWGQREYDGTGIGMESGFDLYRERLAAVFGEVYRVLADDGSLWLNMGDRYHNKDLMGMPWRVAFDLKDAGWILRNDVIWDKVRMTQSAKDRLRDLHEHVFHFVKKSKYYYDRKSILLKHKGKPTTHNSGMASITTWLPGLTQWTSEPTVHNGGMVSITGTSGVRYRKQIRKSTCLTASEKASAEAALDRAITNMAHGKTVDFRMSIRGQQRVSHGSSETLSGRAKEMAKNGYYVIEQKSEGFLPTDIWRIVPEDTHRSDIHCAVYPVSLLEIPIKATCPPGGIVLDPFVGTGTTVVAALKHGRRGIGIDTSPSYIRHAKARIKKFMKTGIEC